VVNKEIKEIEKENFKFNEIDLIKINFKKIIIKEINNNNKRTK